MKHALLLAALTLPMFGCELFLDIDDDSTEPVPDESEPLRAQFDEDVLPILRQACGSCHDGAQAFIDFMAPTNQTPSVFDAILEWPALVNLDEPGNSRLITKGEHEGRSFGTDELSVIIPWLIAVSEQP